MLPLMAMAEACCLSARRGSVSSCSLATAAAEAAQSRGMDVLTGARCAPLATPHRALSERYWVHSECTTSRIPAN